MSFGATRRNVDFARGGQIGANQNFTYVQGQLWIVLGDVNRAHMPPPHIPGPDRMVEGSPFVFINGIPVCRAMHKAGCGHPTTGSSVVFVQT